VGKFGVALRDYWVTVTYGIGLRLEKKEGRANDSYICEFSK